MSEPLLRVAVPVPLRQHYHYLPPPGLDAASLQPGTRLRVPFGKGQRIAVLLGLDEAAQVPLRRLKRVLKVLDNEALLDGDYLEFLDWVSRYYHHPIGEVVMGALPVLLRRGNPARLQEQEVWCLTPAGAALPPDAPPRAPRQRALLTLLRAQPEQAQPAAQLRARLGRDWRRAATAAARGGLVRVETRRCDPHPPAAPRPGPLLNTHQAGAVDAILAALGRFRPLLLDGVTGSGKTEVYLRGVRECLDRGRQALVLIPEIGLTAQTLARFQERLGIAPLLLHSGLADQARLDGWLRARAGEPVVVVGTRSAIWTPLPRLGLIVVDEEHDPSYKQQDGLRYSARDLALVRGQRAQVPVVLGSATPSLESLHNCRRGQYGHLRLPYRTGRAVEPHIVLENLRNQVLTGGLAPATLGAIEAQLAGGRQALVYLNRRGYAPVLLCHACGARFHCERCDAYLTYHRVRAQLRCHHCGASYPAPSRCTQCGDGELLPVGLGTQRLVETLQQGLPQARVLRIDSDSVRGRGTLEKLLADAADGRADVLVGTQMLSKGHHFPLVGLVCVIDADAGLFGSDFRAAERLAQTIVQVGGRAGREDRPGTVVIQTHHPDHPWLRSLVGHGYSALAEQLLDERRQAQLPPYGHLVLVRAEAEQEAAVEEFLNQGARLASVLRSADTQIWGPAPAPMTRVAGRSRWQLLFQSPHRGHLHALVSGWLQRLDELPRRQRVRWSLDVDPQEML